MRKSSSAHDLFVTKFCLFRRSQRRCKIIRRRLIWWRFRPFVASAVCQTSLSMSICCLRCRRRRQSQRSTSSDKQRHDDDDTKTSKMGQKQSLIILANKDIILKAASTSILPSKETSFATWKDRHGEPDLMLIVGRTKFPVHRNILIENSAYFRFAFRGQKSLVYLLPCTS